MSLEDGFYWVKSNTDAAWEVALYTACARWFYGAEEGTKNAEEIGCVLSIQSFLLYKSLEKLNCRQYTY